MRVRRAKQIMLKDATVLIQEEKRVVYWKSGGKIRAERDFWMIDVYGVKKGFDAEDSCTWRCGIVGDSTVEFRDKFSNHSPIPVIYLYKKDSSTVSRVTVVLYSE